MSKGDVNLKYAFLFLLFSLAFITSCSVGPSYDPPCVEVPEEWKNNNDEKCEGTEKGADVNCLDHWWQVFDDDKLNELEAWAIANNRNLYVAYERIQEARALKGIAAADFYPQITLDPQYTNTGELITNYVSPANRALIPSTSPFRAHELFYYLPVDLSYEVDLWGRIRDQYAAAKFNWLAINKDYEYVMLSLTTNLAMAYYQLRAADAQMDLLLEVLKTRQKAYDINLDRYEEEITFYADVTLAAEEIETVKVQYEEIVRQRQVLEDQIAVLIGVPASEFCLEHLPLKGLPPCIPEGIPSDILQRRPDIAEAEYNTKSEHEMVKQAYSQFFPSLTLTATGGVESPIFKDFMKWISRYWMLGGQINQLIFDGLRTPYNFELQIARFKESSGEYQQQVLIAFQEVEDALANLESYAKQYDGALAITQWAKTTNQLYIDRYKLGVIYYIDVANTERDLLNYQINVNVLQGYRYVATIQLIRALGGGW